MLDDQRRWLLTSQHPGLASGLVFPADPSHAERARVKRDDTEVCWFRTDSVLDKPLRKVVAEAGVPRITPHSFRRTYENLLRQSGVDDLVRRSVAGWRTNQAQEIYAGIAPEERAAAARRLEAMVTGSAPARTGTPTGTPEGRTSIDEISLKGDSPEMSGI